MSDAYLKVKDNGAQGLALVREPSEISVVDLKSYSDVTKPAITYTTGKYINVNGTLSNGSNYVYTGALSVKRGDHIVFSAQSRSTNIAMISLCDVDGANRVPVVIGDGTNTRLDYTYDVLFDGYVCFSSFNAAKSVTVYSDKSNAMLDSRVEANRRSIENNLEMRIFDDALFEQGNWQNGAKTASNYIVRSPDGYHTVNPSIITLVPNTRYVTIRVFRNRTENEGTISFSGGILSPSYVNTQRSFSVPANVWVLVLCRKSTSNVAILPREMTAEIYCADNLITKNADDIAALNSEFDDFAGNPPDYWSTELADTGAKIINNRLAAKNKIAEFMFLTDVHWTGNAKKSPVLCKYIAKRYGIADVLMGGDVIYTHNTSKTGAVGELVSFYAAFDGLRMISTIGNHDLNSNNNQDSSTYLTPAELYPVMMGREEAFTDTGADPYVTVCDNDSQKVRYVQFYHPDTVSISQNTKDKVTAAVTGKDNTWTVVLMTHVYWASGSVDQYIGAFTQELAALNADDSHAKIACLIVGHIHKDNTAVVGENLLVIGSQCDIYAQTQGADMTAGTATEQCIEIVQIDTANRVIYLTRLGSGEDRTFSY